MVNSICDLLFEGYSVKLIDLSNFDFVPRGGVGGEFRKLEEARQAWARNLVHTNSIADQIRKLVQPARIATQMAAQFHSAERERLANIKKMLEPLESIRARFQMDTSIKKMLDDLSRPKLFNDELLKKANETALFNTALDAVQNSVPSALLHAQRTFAASWPASGFIQVMKTFEEAKKHWTVPAELIDSVGALKAMREHIDSLTLPVLDWVSAATLAKVLGSEGIEAHLAALGIRSDGTLADEASEHSDEGIGLSRKSLELMTLLSLILAILVPIYQEYSSGQWQQQTDKKLDAHSVMLDAQTRRFEALSILVEKALVREAKHVGQRFVVLDRVAIVRNEPRHGAAVMGKLLPCEVVKPIAEQGKWIQFEYYHWLLQAHQTGWALKKQFKRVPSAYAEE